MQITYPHMPFTRRFNRAYNRIIKPYLARKKRKRSVVARKRRKSSYRRKRGNRRRRGFGYPRGIKSIGTTAMNFFPPTKRIVSFYESGFSLSAPASEDTISGKTFRLRDWYDPDYALGGENSVDRVFWSQMYKYYRVHAVKFEIKMEASSQTTIDSKVGFYVTRCIDHGGQNIPEGIEMVPVPTNQPEWHRWLSSRDRIIKEKTIGGSSRWGHPSPSFKCYVNLDKYDKISGKNRVLENSSQAPTTTEGNDFFMGYTRSRPVTDYEYAHPRKSNYLQVYTREGPSGGTGTAVVATIKIWFYLELSSPQIVFHTTQDGTEEYDDNYISRVTPVDYPAGETPTP